MNHHDARGPEETMYDLRRWFRPDARVGVRQRACTRPECQAARRQKTQASWRKRNQEYAIGWRLDQRATQAQQPPEALRLPAPLNQLPWEFAKDQFGPQGADFIGVMGALILLTAKDQFRPYLLDPTGLPSGLPLFPKRPVPACRILNPEQATMQLEFHQLDRRWEHLRVREPQRQRRLLASLADSGQQTPIVVVAAGPPDRYLVIDGHKRVAALEQLGRDTVEATVWAMSEAEAVLLSRSLRFSPQESALEQGWLLAEMEQRFGYGLDELGAPLRPQPQLGVAAAGAGGVVAGSHPAARTRRKTRGASGHEVSGAGGASQRQ
jgi:hypothetical protein